MTAALISLSHRRLRPPRLEQMPNQARRIPVYLFPRDLLEGIYDYKVSTL
jgi:hypothetical protein